MASTWVDGASPPTAELQKQYSEAGFSNLHVSQRSLEDWYRLVYNLECGKVLPAIHDGQVKHLVESSLSPLPSDPFHVSI
jgi:hypothetical protein